MRVSRERTSEIEPGGRTAIVLAGGRSVRMGMDKASLVLQGESLLARVIGRIAAHWDSVLVVAAPGQSLPKISTDSVRVLRDEYPGKGPLSGIYTGLKAARTTYCSVVACDMPFANSLLLSYMLDAAQAGDYEAVIPLAGGRLQYLHAVYKRTLFGPIEQALRGDLLAIHTFVGNRHIRTISESDVMSVEPEMKFHLNVNTPEDLTRAVNALT